MPEGTRAYWEKGVGVWHTRCPRTANGQSTEDAYTRWVQLIGYYLRCLTAEGVGEPPEIREHSRWKAIPIGEEQIVTGRDDQIAWTGIDDLNAALGRDEELLYGWPVLVVHDAARRARVLPVMVVPLEGEDGHYIAGDEPSLNPALFEWLQVEDDVRAQVLLGADQRFPFGDAPGVQQAVSETLTTLGIDHDDVLDPDRLSRDLTPTPGLHNWALAMRASSNAATRALVEDLRAIRDRQDLRGTAAELLVTRPNLTPNAAPAGTAAIVTLNDAQDLALRAAMQQPLTVVTGPPGTGKSQFVAAVVGACWAEGQSVLVASTNNRAVDVAVERATRLDPGILIRTGNRAVREGLPATLEALAARDPRTDARPLHQAWRPIVEARDRYLAALQERSQVERDLLTASQELNRAAQHLWGGTTPAELPPIATLERQAQRLVRARLLRKWRMRRFASRLQLSASAAGAADVLHWAATARSVGDLRTRLQQLPPRDPVQEARTLAHMDEEWLRASTAAVGQQILDSLAVGRAHLQALARTSTGDRRGRTAAIAAALPTVRGWACTALSMASNFPREPGLFDVVIIDEASQCTVADVLPILFRARRAVIVGDANQLAPVTRLSEARLAGLAQQSQLDPGLLARLGLRYGLDSAFQATVALAGSGAVHLLDEHYRCHPEVAAFVNRQFYGGQLRVLTDVAELPGDHRGLSWVAVRGSAERPRGGRSLINRGEADAVASWLMDHADSGATVGVVTPFAAQARLIEDVLRRRLGTERIEELDLRVGTAHRFQGDERDVMLFSAVVSDDMPSRAIRWLMGSDNLLNVAVSRARSALVVVGDPDAARRHGLTSLMALHDAAERRITATDVAIAGGLHSDTERILYDALLRAGCSVDLKLNVEGYELDFAIRTSGCQLNIEVDGGHHLDIRGRQRRQDLLRDARLERLGWTVLRVPAWRCSIDLPAVVTEVREVMARA